MGVAVGGTGVVIDALAAGVAVMIQTAGMGKSNEEPFVACLGPGYCLPREFLRRYANLDVPELGHDELRLPLFGRLLGLEVARWLHEEGATPLIRAAQSA